MSMWVRKCFRACGLATAAGLAVANPSGTHAAPYVPASDALILERLPSAGSVAARTLRNLHRQLAQTPNDMQLALRVASQDIELARAEGDPRYNGYAEAAIAPWRDLADPTTDIRIMRATLSQSRHDFPSAIDDLNHVITTDPAKAQAWLTRATIREVTGDYEGAFRDCLALSHLTDPLVATICIANVQSLTGHAQSAYSTLSQMLENTPAEPQIRLWGLTILAETAARLGRAGDADRYFKQALALGVSDSYLLGAYADFLLDENRPADVRALLQDRKRIDPLLLRLTLAEQQLNAPEFTRDLADLGERFAASRQRGDTIHRREEARFALDLVHDPAQALQLALANWQVQREPWDARLVLAAAHGAATPSAAAPVRQWLDKSHLEDVRLAAFTAGDAR